MEEEREAAGETALEMAGSIQRRYLVRKRREPVPFGAAQIPTTHAKTGAGAIIRRGGIMRDPLPLRSADSNGRLAARRDPASELLRGGPLRRSASDDQDQAADHPSQRWHEKHEAQHREERPPAPSMVFAMPGPQHPPATAGEAVHLAGGGAADLPAPGASARKADPRQVSDRVYELMQREIRLGLERGFVQR